MAINLYTRSPAAPSHFEAQALLNLFQQGNWEKARLRAEELTKKYPKHALGWSILGAIFRARRDLTNALPHLQKAAEISSTDASAHLNIANTLRDLGRPEEACHHYYRALKLKPDLPHGFFHLGNLQQDSGQITQAERSYRRALEFAPDHVESLSNLACILQEIGRLSEALELSLRALRIQPTNSALHYNHCDLLLEMGLIDQAEIAARESIRLTPDIAQTYALLANVLKAKNDLHGAVHAYMHALKIEPDNTDIHSNLLFTLSYLPRWNQVQTLDYAKAFGKTCSNKAKSLSQEWIGDISPHALRVGLVSADLRNHPVGHFLEGVLRNIDPTRIELVALSTQNFGDELTQRIRPAFREWHSLAGIPDHEAASMIRRLGLHLVLDLSGHTAGNRLPLFAYRLAPVQVTWLGYFATTGVQEMDYLLADSASLPTKFKDHFTETIWHLPDTRLCFTPPSVDIDVNPLPAFSTGVVTFGSTSNLLKLNDEVVALWSRILKTVPKSRLLLQAKQLSHSESKDVLCKRFNAHGVAAERLILAPPENRANYLKTYHRIDFCLDPFPFPGGTTTAESLWMGVPVLTLNGDNFLARQGSAIMAAVGLEEWIAEDEQDYLARAVHHSQNIATIAQLRQNLRSKTLASALFDAPRFARNLEAALWGMWVKRKQAPH